MYSMTGYGRADYSADVDITVEIKTVNNRYFDMNLKAPRAFLAFEEAIKKAVQAKFPRGHADVFVSFRDKRERPITVTTDTALAKAYVAAAKALVEATGVRDDITAVTLLRLPEIVKTETEEGDNEVLLPILLDTVNAAMDKLCEMQKTEGEKLKQDMLSRVAVIEETVGKIALRAPQILAEHREKILTRMREALAGVTVDESRLLTEAAMFADKCNVDEELTRLGSHIAQFREIVKGENVGKKLDFLVQEFNREANTICSKSNDGQTTEYALSLKCEIEKIREQVQNVQ